ncbi:hypothetical protein [Nocardia jiangxiensis]|uniref:hypothetical protein n=1 Tax=Nocardia jiangxiensis TaxID=282685 RepID=UPI00031685F2|nr:hypothetical protein [Nocardia jiangxiensis]
MAGPDMRSGFGKRCRTTYYDTSLSGFRDGCELRYLPFEGVRGAAAHSRRHCEIPATADISGVRS